MNADERELLEGLHALASDGPGQAPVEVETRLLTEFRKRSRLRRSRTWLSAASIGGIAAAIAVLLWFGPLGTKPVVPAPEAAALSDASAGFYPLPDADALPPVESALVVRV